VPAAGSCRVCSHSDRQRIEDLRAGGASWRSLSLEVGLPESTIRVHFARCRRKKASVPRLDGPAPARAELELPPVALPEGDPQATLLRELQAIHGTALEAFDRAAGAKDDRTIALLVQQLRNNLKAQSDIMARARKDDRPPAERLAANPEWGAFRRRFLSLLDRRPDLREAVVDDLSGFLDEEPASA
jgi:hypothetical protein